MTNFLERLVEFRHTLTEDFIASEEAHNFVEQMASDHPDELDAWMHDYAVEHARQWLTSYLHSERRLALARKAPRAFATAVESGDVEALGIFRTVHEINVEHVRRAVGEMTGADHLYVSGCYATTGRRALMLSEFHAAVARKVKKRRTSDVFSEREYKRLYDSIVPPDEEAQAA